MTGRRRALAAATVAVALLVVAPGCLSGVFGGGSGTATTTAEGPPGVSDGVLADPGALYGAHVAALNGSSYRATATFEGATGGLGSLNVTADGSSELVSFRTPNATVAVYRRGPVTYRRTDAGPLVEYTYAENASDEFDAVGRLFVERRFLATALSVGEFEVTGTVTRDGRRLTRLRATSTNASGGDGGRVTDLNATMLVDGSGVVREFEGTVTQRVQGGTERVSLSYAVETGVSPSRPGWADNATRVEAAVVAGGRAIRLSHRGGRPLGAFAGVRVGDPVRAAGSLGVDLEAGDTVYVHGTGDGLAVVPERSAVPDDGPVIADGPTLVVLQGGSTTARVVARPANASARLAAGGSAPR